MTILIKKNHFTKFNNLEKNSQQIRKRDRYDRKKSEYWMPLGMGAGKLLGVMVMFIILIIMTVSQVHTYVKFITL